MQKIVREYSKIVWTDESVKEFANKMMKEVINDLRCDNDYEFEPCLDVDLESFNDNKKADEVLLGSLEDTDTICYRLNNTKTISNYYNNTIIATITTGSFTLAGFLSVENFVDFELNRAGDCWRAKNHAEALDWLREEE